MATTSTNVYWSKDAEATAITANTGVLRYTVKKKVLFFFSKKEVRTLKYSTHSDTDPSKCTPATIGSVWHNLAIPAASCDSTFTKKPQKLNDWSAPNCINCGAPLNFYKDACEYCRTWILGVFGRKGC